MSTPSPALSTSQVRPQQSSSQHSYSSWGRYPRAEHSSVRKVYWEDQLPQALAEATAGSLLPYGLGRSYGDSCLNDGGGLVDCSRMNHFLGFDPQSGVLRCEAGVSLSDILDTFVSKGWFLPVTPGTRFVTIGGAVANDVHGKNHHRAGTLGCHVRSLAVYRSDYGMVECSREVNPDFFSATIGGLGLTGIIAWVELQLKPIHGPMIDAETIPFRSLDEFRAIGNDSDDDFEYTVAWLDCFSSGGTRGIFFRGNHSDAKNARQRGNSGPSVPFALPEWALSGPAMKLFNSSYFAWHSWRKGKALVHYEPFFYPLDSIRNWNLIYGKRGFLQYQCVIPESASAAFQELLDLISRAKTGSFLGVMKRFGSIASPGMLSFPRPGLTLALDFPMRGEKTLQLLNALDRVVLESGGALYPAKDARMSPAMFNASFPEWRNLRRYIDPKLSSSFWRRVAVER